MAKARLLEPWVGEEQRSAPYHVVSRTIHQQYLLGGEEEGEFVKLMRLYEIVHGNAKHTSAWMSGILNY